MIGRIASLGNPYDRRRSYGSIPQAAHLSGLPQPVNQGDFIRLGDRTALARAIDELSESTGSYGMSTSPFRRGPMITPPDRSRLASQIRYAKTRPEFNPANAPEEGIGPLLRGETDRVEITVPNRERAVALTQDDLPFRRGEGPAYDVILADYARQLQGDVGGLPEERGTRDLSGSNIDSSGYSSEDPTLLAVKREFTGEINPYGISETSYRSPSGQIRGTVRIDPTQIVDTRAGDPENTAAWKVQEEITLGKLANEALDANKTPVILQSAVEEGLQPTEAFPQGKVRLYNEPEKEIAAKRLGIWNERSGAGSLVGHIYQLEVQKRGGEARTVAVPKPLFAVRKRNEDGEWESVPAKRAIPDPNDRFNSVIVQEEPMYRIGNPQARNWDQVREELAEGVDMRTMRRRRQEGTGFSAKKARSTISFRDIEGAERQGYKFERVSDDGSISRMIRPDGSETQLLKDPNANRFYIADAFEGGKRYEVGPTPFLTKEFKEDVIPEKVGGIRIAGERKYGDPSFNKTVEDIAKGAFMDRPSSADRQALNQLADAAITGQLAGRGGRKQRIDPRQIYAIIDEGGPENRRLFDIAVAERSQRYGLRRGREVDLFAEGTEAPIDRVRDEQVLREEILASMEAETGRERGYADFGERREGGTLGLSTRSVPQDKGKEYQPISAPRVTDASQVAREIANQYTKDPDKAAYLAKIGLQQSTGDIDLGTSNLPQVIDAIARTDIDSSVKTVSPPRREKVGRRSTRKQAQEVNEAFKAQRRAEQEARENLQQTQTYIADAQANAQAASALTNQAQNEQVATQGSSNRPQAAMYQTPQNSATNTPPSPQGDPNSPEVNPGNFFQSIQRARRWLGRR